MRVYLSPSQQEHNAYAKGLGVESYHARRVCGIAAKVLRNKGVTVRVAKDYTHLDEPYDYLTAVRDSNAWNPDIHIAVHSNAGGGRGTDTFYTSEAGKKLAIPVQKSVAKVSPGVEKSLRIHHKDGWAELDGTNAPAILIELEFHDWITGAKHIATHPAYYGEALANGILDYAGIKPDTHSDKQKRLRKLFLSMTHKEQDWVLEYIDRWHEKGR